MRSGLGAITDRWPWQTLGGSEIFKQCVVRDEHHFRILSYSLVHSN